MAVQKRYDNLDGLRAISCIGIIGMHIKANSSFQIHGYLYGTVIPSLTLLVYLFIMIINLLLQKLRKGATENE